MTWCIASHKTPVRLDYLLIASWTLNWDLISPCHRMAFAYGNKHKHCMFLFLQTVKKNTIKQDVGATKEGIGHVWCRTLSSFSIPSDRSLRYWTPLSLHCAKTSVWTLTTLNHYPERKPLPSLCPAFSHAFSVNLCQWHIWDMLKNSFRPCDPKCIDSTE